MAGRRSSLRWFFDAFRLRAPSLGLDVASTPLVTAPAHHMPIDYFSGPTQVEGTMNGQPVAGFGFHERTLPLSSPRQLVVVLHDSVRNLPTEALSDSPLTAAQLADLVWETMRLVEDRHYISARNWVEETIRPALSRLADSHRAHLLLIADDLIRQMTPFA